MSEPVLQLRGVVKEYVVPGPVWRKPRLRAVDGVDLVVGRGEVVGLVGESGSGKSTVARCALGLIPVDAGSVVYDGIEVGTARAADSRRLRREIQLVFQHPVAALNPRLSVDAIVAEPITTHRLARGAELRARVAELLESVGLTPKLGRRLPHELSGGQAQRVVLARSLATRPRLLVLDEPTASLDVIVQAQILNLLLELQALHGLTYLLISHDLSVVRHLSHRVYVMYLGRVVEEGHLADVLDGPRHPYTQALLASVRGKGHATLDRSAIVRGETPPAWAIPPGCRFHPRCALYETLGSPERCTAEDPPLGALPVDRAAACHFADRAAGEAALAAVSGRGAP